jgi:hypothetical protein
MRYIPILPNVQTPPLPTPTGLVPQNLQFKNVVINTWLLHPEHFGQGIHALRSGIKLTELFSAAEVGQTIAVEDADYDRLRKAVETAPYNPVIFRYLLPFADAILNASTTPPPPL